MSSSRHIHGYVALECSSAHYRGISREEWPAQFEEFFHGELEPGLRAIVERMNQDPQSQCFAPKFVRTWSDVESLMEHTPEANVDLVGFFSPYLERQKSPSWEERRARFIGIDVVPVGEESLLYKLEQARALSDPDDRASVGLDEFLARHVNQDGLLRSNSSKNAVLQFYDQLVAKEWIEEYTTDFPDSPESVRVFLIE